MASGHVRLADCVLAVFSVAGEHFQWQLATLLEALYPTVKPAKRKDKWKAILKEIVIIHEQMWPGIPVPMPRRLETTNAALETCVTTSFLFATLVWGWVSPKRGNAAKMKCADLLAAALKTACGHGDGLHIQFPAMHPDGTHESRQQVVGSDMIVNCWTASMSSAVSFYWDNDYRNEDLKIPSSTRTRTHLSDYILWCLQPVPLNHKAVNLRGCKTHLARSAKQMVTHLALCFEVAVVPHCFKQADNPELDQPFAVLQTRGSKRRRFASTSLNAVAARAAQKLYLGKERVFSGTFFLGPLDIHI